MSGDGTPRKNLPLPLTTSCVFNFQVTTGRELQETMKLRNVREREEPVNYQGMIRNDSTEVQRYHEVSTKMKAETAK